MNELLNLWFDKIEKFLDNKEDFEDWKRCFHLYWDDKDINELINRLKRTSNISIAIIRFPDTKKGIIYWNKLYENGGKYL